MGLFEEPRRVRVHVHPDPDQVETIRRMAERADRGVSAAQVHSVAVREGLAVLERMEAEAEREASR